MLKCQSIMDYNFFKNKTHNPNMYVIIFFLLMFNIVMEQCSKFKTKPFPFLMQNEYESVFKYEYFSILVYLILALIISLILIGLSYLLVMQIPYTEKASPYECGFEPYEDARNQYNVKFYLIAIIFIIFDIETMFILPWCVSIAKLNLLGFWSMIDFIIELGVGYMYIWCSGLFEWD